MEHGIHSLVDIQDTHIQYNLYNSTSAYYETLTQLLSTPANLKISKY